MSVWMLKLERVGITDDFFEIGGDSLLVTQLVIRLRETYKTELPLRQFFSHRTPAQRRSFTVSLVISANKCRHPESPCKRFFVNFSDDDILVTPVVSTSAEDA